MSGLSFVINEAQALAIAKLAREEAVGTISPTIANGAEEPLIYHVDEDHFLIATNGYICRGDCLAHD